MEAAHGFYDYLETQQKIITKDEPPPGAGEPEKSIWDNPFNLPALVDAEPTIIKWFIGDRIISGRGAVVSGIGGSSKTRFMIYLAVAASLGRLPWDWQVIQRGKSILVLTEDTEEEFHRVLHYICISLGLSKEEKRKLYNDIIVFPLAGKDCILLQKNKSGNLEKSALFNGLVKFIEQQENIVFVGLDPALSLTDGDEIDQSHQRRLGKMADDLAVKTHAAVLLVAHAAKNLKEEITSHNSRGGGALVDAIRTEFVLRNMTKKEAQRAKVNPEDRFKLVQLVATKGNFLPSEAYLPVWLQRDQYGNLSAADIEIKLETTNAIGRKEKDALNVLVELCKDGALPKFKEWMQACIKAGIIKKKKQKAQEKEMYEIRKKLYEAGEIKKAGYGVWIPETDEEDAFDGDFNY